MAVQGAGTGIQKAEPEAKGRYIRVKVIDHNKEGEPAVNIRMPVGIVKFGMKMAQSFSPEMKNADVDWDSVARMIEEGGRGELVHVEDEGEHKTIDVWVE